MRITRIVDAVVDGNLEALQEALLLGGDPNECCEEGSPALVHAIQYRQVDFVAALLAAGADADRVIGDNDYTPLSVAVSLGEAEIAELLLTSGADPNGQGVKFPPLHYAASEGWLHCMRILVTHGASLEARSDRGDTPLMIAAAKEDSAETFFWLLEHGADINAANLHGQTVTWNAAACGHKEHVRALIARGARVSAPDSAGGSPIFRAAANGHAETVSALLKAGVSPNEGMPDGWTPILAAARYGHAAVAHELIEHGAYPNQRLSDGWTPIMLAARYGHTAVARALIEHGADLYARNARGGNVFMLSAAFRQKHDEVFDLLLDNAKGGPWVMLMRTILGLVPLIPAVLWRKLRGNTQSKRRNGAALSPLARKFGDVFCQAAAGMANLAIKLARS